VDTKKEEEKAEKKQRFRGRGLERWNEKMKKKQTV